MTSTNYGKKNPVDDRRMDRKTSTWNGRFYRLSAPVRKGLLILVGVSVAIMCGQLIYAGFHGRGWNIIPIDQITRPIDSYLPPKEADSLRDSTNRRGDMNKYLPH